MALVVGEPGVGKSRLTEELLGGVTSEARVLRGRCLPYGRGITFWPLVEIVRDAASLRDTDAPELAREKLSALVPGTPDVAERVASAVGLSDAEFSLDEIYWGRGSCWSGSPPSDRWSSSSMTSTGPRMRSWS